VGGLRKSAKSRTSNHSLIRWGGLALIALAELTWLAIWVEVPATGFLSVFKGFPSIFITSFAVVTVLVWARSRGKLRDLPIFQDFSHNPWPMVLAHLGAFALFSHFTIFVAEGDASASDLAVYWILAWAATRLGGGALMHAHEIIHFSLFSKKTNRFADSAMDAAVSPLHEINRGILAIYTLGYAVWTPDGLIMRRFEYPSYSFDDLVQIEPIIPIHRNALPVRAIPEPSLSAGDLRCVQNASRCW